MHTVHFFLVNADAAEQAANIVDLQISGWGGEDNWYQIGGVASEDGTDDIDNYSDCRFPLAFLDEDQNIPKEGTCFQRAVIYLSQHIHCPSDLNEEIGGLSDQLRAFNAEHGNAIDLWSIAQELLRLRDVIESRRQGGEIPEFRPWQLTEFGLTDLDHYEEEESEKRRYIVFVDMHS
jgi:hypothetical protein